jgi:glyoxylase-like metal-dependent hydrolase (beta-lactamase superfamily II)
MRYRPAQWAHHPKIIEHDPAGDTWQGFAAAEQLDTIAPGIVLIALPGHTRGHAAVAVDTGDRWLLHAGDAFYHHGTLDGHSRVPAIVRAGETLLSYDLKKVRDNHARLAELHQRADPALIIICSHDPALYEPLKARVTA